MLFDGVCNLCNAAVAWLVERDPDGVFRFASLQSEAARGLLRGGERPDGGDPVGSEARGTKGDGRRDDDPGGGASSEPGRGGGGAPGSVVLVDEEGVHERSDAVLRIARRLGLPWSLLTVGFIVPRFLRDAVYRWVARNRYRWFGRREACMVPGSEVAGRFLDGGE